MKNGKKLFFLSLLCTYCLRALRDPFVFTNKQSHKKKLFQSINPQKNGPSKILKAHAL